ncbi:MAG: hypothetical protein K0Q79_1528 [Flavipsychrobacter sp.]|nr:hypothetical protein [Flavipsychrobacter sp.]
MDMPRNETKEYISQNKLLKITAPFPLFKAIPRWNDSMQHIPAQQLFYKKGTYKKESWMVLFDSSTATVWIELEG